MVFAALRSAAGMPSVFPTISGSAAIMAARCSSVSPSHHALIAWGSLPDGIESLAASAGSATPAYVWSICVSVIAPRSAAATFSSLARRSSVHLTRSASYASIWLVQCAQSDSRRRSSASSVGSGFARAASAAASRARCSRSLRSW